MGFGKASDYQSTFKYVFKYVINLNKGGLRGTRGSGQVLVPLWEQLPSELALLPPQAESLPCGWSAAASAQPAPASLEVAGFGPQSTTNKPKATQSLASMLKTLCYILASGSGFLLHKVKRVARNTTVGQGKRGRGTQMEKGWVRVGWAGSEEESIHNDTKTDKTRKKRERETSPSQWVHVKKQASVFEASHSVPAALVTVWIQQEFIH